MKTREFLSGKSLDRLLVIREVWRRSSLGERVCVVTPSPLGKEGLLSSFGEYRKPLEVYVNKGIIYNKSMDSSCGDFALSEEDLNNFLVEDLYVGV